MSTRPKWADRLRFWLADDQYDGLPDPDVSRWQNFRWTWRGWREEAGLWALCMMFGHKPVPDQCNKPEHDFCVYCIRRMPNQAERRTA